jgi:hypothetical protein
MDGTSSEQLFHRQNIARRRQSSHILFCWVIYRSILHEEPPPMPEFPVRVNDQLGPLSHIAILLGIYGILGHDELGFEVRSDSCENRSARREFFLMRHPALVVFGARSPNISPVSDKVKYRFVAEDQISNLPLVTANVLWWLELEFHEVSSLVDFRCAQSDSMLSERLCSKGFSTHSVIVESESVNELDDRRWDYALWTRRMADRSHIAKVRDCFFDSVLSDFEERFVLPNWSMLLF